ncbi:copper chaperone PCu(A)C [Colwellia sp. E2M01]|uniref:copper chaperone PCu(A)C n=1 Tax=Colwellia sp. E2M01 TaxID=2841561 RepID=UPI001C0995B8|nr:copper chaperone PCu(A)C [Colwellia sp. E2M01]MBU2871009.1 copper chaperone PCu(A)C [Colwellia sp. E2M01]
MIIINIKQLLLGFSLLLSTLSYASANDKVSITDGFIKPTIPGSTVTAAYMTINNLTDNTITLQKVTGDISSNIEIHEHTMSDGMMRMREVEHIQISAHNKAVLQPSGLHLMFFAVKQQITEQDTIPLTLYFSDQSTVNIQLPVRR